MEVFEVIVAFLVGGAALAGLARHIGAPYPALVALAGAALALLPGVPSLALDPELALALFVAPVLVDSAFDASPRDLKANWRQVSGLAIGAVLFTIAVVALVARHLVPDLPWAAAIALGAIVAPPDASAATTVLKQLRPPHRLLVILEGESLFNDASALLVYRLAVGAVATGLLTGSSVVPTLLLMTVGSGLFGWALARLSMALMARIHDVAISVVFQFCTTFGIWLLAENLHLSGIITMVVYAMVAARQASEVMPARLRVPSWAVWEVAVFVLNVLAFILVGFQLRSIVARIAPATEKQYLLVAGAVCLAVILARIAWVAGAAAYRRWRCRAQAKSADLIAMSPAGAAVVGWCGMRGTVTLAAALALPAGGAGVAPFPYRDLIVVCAFGVVLGTLVLQGLTLRPLMLRLRLEDDGEVDREASLARIETLREAITVIAGSHGDVAALLRRRLELQLRFAEARGREARAAQQEAVATGGRWRRNRRRPADDLPESTDLAVAHLAIAAQRRRLMALRTDGSIGDAAFQQVEEELDWAEMNTAYLWRIEPERPLHG